MKSHRKYGETAFGILAVMVALLVTIQIINLYKKEVSVTVVEYDGFEFNVKPKAIELDNSIFIPVDSILKYEGYQKVSETDNKVTYSDYNNTKLLMDLSANLVSRNDFKYASGSRLLLKDECLFMDINLLSNVIGKRISFAENKLTFSDLQYKPYEWIQKSGGFIAKSCGSVNGINGANSYDALVSSYNSGFRVFEVDLTYSIDGYLICSDNSKSGKNYIDMNLEEFKQSKANKRFATMDFEALVKLMSINRDMFIVTDTSHLNLNFSQVFGDVFQTAMKHDTQILKRIIPQVYSIQDYTFLKNTYPFENVIFNATDPDYSEYDILMMMNNNDLLSVMLPVSKINDTFMGSLLENGKKVFVDEVNKPVDAEMLRKMGVAGFCTDVLKP